MSGAQGAPVPAGWRQRWLAALAGAAAATSAYQVFAQTNPDAGSTLRQLEPPVLTLPRKPPPAPEFGTPARPVLEPAPAIRFKLAAFRISGATVFSEPELQSLVREYIGREVGIAELGESVGRITGFYSERGYPLATAYLPVQSIEGGVVEIVVLEGRYGNLHLLNRARLSNAVAAAHVQGFQGTVVHDATLERKLLLLHDLPGVDPGRAVLSPGEAVGETDLRIELNPGERAGGAIELDNHGSRFTGATRLSGQFDLYSPARLGDWLSVRAAKGDPGLEYARIGYQVPFGGDGLRLGGAYSHVRYRLGGTFAALDASGSAGSATLLASYPLIRSRRHSLYGRLAFESKVLQDRVNATATVSDRQSRTATFALAGDFFDALGAGGASAYSLGYTGGRLRIETPAVKAADDASARTHGSFHRWNLSFARQQALGERTALFVSFYGQKAGRNLDSSEKMILGGVNGVRAYPQGEASGDSGYLLAAELRYAFNIDALPGAWRAAGFLDTGEVRLNERPFAQPPNRRRLSGGGLSLEWSRAGDFALRLAIAHRIGNEPATAGSDVRSRGWLQAVKYF